MLIPIVPERVYAPLATEFVKLVAAANVVVDCQGHDIHVRAVKRRNAYKAAYAQSKKAFAHAVFWHTPCWSEIVIAVPWVRASAVNIHKIARSLAHECRHLKQWLAGEPVVEPDTPDMPIAEAVRVIEAWENPMLDLILDAYHNPPPVIVPKRSRKPRTQ